MLFFRHLGLRHAEEPAVVERRRHLGLERCEVGCGALVLRWEVRRHGRRCRGSRAGGDPGPAGEHGGTGGPTTNHRLHSNHNT